MLRNKNKKQKTQSHHNHNKLIVIKHRSKHKQRTRTYNTGCTAFKILHHTYFLFPCMYLHTSCDNHFGCKMSYTTVAYLFTCVLLLPQSSACHVRMRAKQAYSSGYF